MAVEPVLLLTAVTLGLLWALAKAAGLFGIFLAVPLGAATILYPYALVAAIAADRRPPPALTAQFDPVSNAPLLAHGLVLLLALFAASALEPAWPAWLAVVAIAPASIALSATTGRVLHALNPVSWLALIGRVGAAYLAPLAVCGGGFALAQTGVFDLPLAGPVLALYGWLLFTAAIGLMLQWRRDSLDLPIVTRAERLAEGRRRDRQKAWDVTLDEAYVNLSRGDTERGYALLRGMLERDGNTLDAYAYVHETFASWSLPVEFASFTRRYVERLVAAGDLQRALEVTELQLRRNEDFRPSDDDSAALAVYATEVGHDATAGLLVTPIAR